MHESGAGNVSFTVPGNTHTYLAVIADKPGYYDYGCLRPHDGRLLMST
jgi:hypothetical protein